MDPITAAIVAGLAAGASQVGASAVVDAYRALKNVLKQKFGHDSEIVKAVDNLEAKPDSEARKGVLQEEAAAVKADQDQEILAAAQAVLDHATPAQNIVWNRQKIEGNKNIQVGPGGYVNVTARQQEP